MKRIISLLTLALTVLLQANAQEQWNAVKVFDFDPGTESVYNLYIDTIDTIHSGPIFCFQTETRTIGKKSLIKTDDNGSVLQTTLNPYKFYTILNGDTLILKNDEVTNIYGETISSCYRSGHEHAYIAASSMGIYVYEYGRAASNCIRNVMQNKERRFIELSAKSLNGLCCGGGVVYAITASNTITLKKEDLSSDETTITVEPTKLTGIAEYDGSLYVYSNADKAVYRLESAGGITVVKPTQTQIEALQTVYYNLLGEETDSPSGLTIVVTRFSDGSTKTEKQLFR